MKAYVNQLILLSLVLFFGFFAMRGVAAANSYLLAVFAVLLGFLDPAKGGNHPNP